MKKNRLTFLQEFISATAGGILFSVLPLLIASTVASNKLDKILSAPFETGTMAPATKGIIFVVILCIIGSLFGLFVANKQDKNAKIIIISLLSLLLIPIYLFLESYVIQIFCIVENSCPNLPGDMQVVAVIASIVLVALPFSILFSVIVSMVRKL